MKYFCYTIDKWLINSFILDKRIKGVNYGK